MHISAIRLDFIIFQSLSDMVHHMEAPGPRVSDVAFLFSMAISVCYKKRHTSIQDHFQAMLLVPCKRDFRAPECAHSASR